MKCPIDTHYLNGVIDTAINASITDSSDQIELIKAAMVHRLFSNPNFLAGFDSIVTKSASHFSIDDVYNATYEVFHKRASEATPAEPIPPITMSAANDSKITNKVTNAYDLNKTPGFLDSVLEWIEKHPRLFGSLLGGGLGALGHRIPLYGGLLGVGAGGLLGAGVAAYLPEIKKLMHTQKAQTQTPLTREQLLSSDNGTLELPSPGKEDTIDPRRAAAIAQGHAQVAVQPPEMREIVRSQVTPGIDLAPNANRLIPDMLNTNNGITDSGGNITIR